MLKNSKLLKGIVISLAFVLVLGGAFLLKQWAEASEKTVVFYVDDSGDNTTGKDIASAFTTIGGATQAATEMGLEPGTEVRILIGERVTLTTQSLDVNIAKDKNGDKLPVVVTSMNADDPDNYAEIYQAYRITGAIATDGSQRARIINTLTLKDIVLKAKVHDVYANDKDTGKQGGLYRVRRLYVDGNDVTFDNVRFTTDFGDTIDGGTTWTVYCDDCTAGTKKDSPTVTFKNGDYSNVYIYGHGTIMPNYDVTVNFDNCTLSTFYAIANSDKTTNVNCNSLTVSFKDTYVKSFYPFNGGDYTIPDGVEYSFENTYVETFRTKGRESEILRGDLTWNIKDGTEIHTDNSTLYFAPVKELHGNLTSNISGGTFVDSLFVGGIGCVIDGDVVNNVTGGDFKKYFAGGGRYGVITGNVTNNISGSPTFGGRYLGAHGAKVYSYNAHSSVGNIVNNISGSPTFKAVYCGGSIDGIVGNITNRIEGPAIFEQNYFGGSGDGTVISKDNFTSYPTTGHVENIINGAVFQSSYYGGSQTGTVEDIYNEVFGDNAHGDLVVAYYYGGGASGCTNVGNVVNKVSNTRVEKSYCGGGNAKATKDVQNFIGDDVYVHNFYYGGTYTGTAEDIENKITGKNVVLNQQSAAYYIGGNRDGACKNVRNEITSDAKFGLFGNASQNYYVGGNMKGNCENVENFLTGKVAMDAVYVGGSRANNMGNIYNEFSGGVVFKDWVYASSYAAKGNNVGDTVNNISAATFNKFVCLGPVFCNGQNVTNYITSDKVTIKQSYYGGTYSADASAKTVANYISGGVVFTSTSTSYCPWLSGSKGKVANTINIISGSTFGSYVYGGMQTGTCGDIYNEISNVNFNNTFVGGSHCKDAACTTGNVTNNFNGNVFFKEYFYAGNAGKAASVVGNVTNHLNGVTFSKMYLGGTVDGKCGTVVNNVIANTTFKDYYYAGGYNATSDTGDIYNYISAGTFTKDYYGGSRDGAADNIYNYVLGSVTFPATYYGGNKTGSNGNIENVMYANVTFNGIFIGAGATKVNGNITNWAMQGTTFNKEYYGGSYGANTKAGNIVNNIIGAKFGTSGVWLGGNNGTTQGTTTNNLSGVTFKGKVYGGKRNNGTCGDIVNNITSCKFEMNFAGGNPTGGNCGNITNNIQGSTVFQQKYTGGNEGGSSTVASVTNEFYSVTMNGAYNKGSSGKVSGSVTVNVHSEDDVNIPA